MKGKAKIRCHFGRHSTQCRHFEGSRLASVVGLAPGAFDVRDVAEISHAFSGLEAYDEVREARAIIEENRRGRWVRQEIDSCHRIEEIVFDDPEDSGKRLLQRFREARNDIIAIHAETPHAELAVRTDKSLRNRHGAIEKSRREGAL